jgi:protein-tyrosine phosphatase
MIDIHTHILPGIDDGSKSSAMTAEMCRVAVADGTTHIVATPHCNDEFAYHRERFIEMLGLLHDSADGRLAFSLGCDFHFSCDNIRDALDHPRRYTIADTQYLLIEFSDYGLPPTVEQDVLSLLSCGMTPILTHPERNRPLRKTPERVLELVGRGCLVQVTANALTGSWGAGPQTMAEWLLSRRAVHVIASDAHDPVRRRPVMSEARERISQLAGEDVAEALVRGNPAAIVDGRPLPYLPDL